MNIQSNVSENVLTISLAGRFDFSGYQEFKSCYEDLPEKPEGIVVDFLGATYLDSSALGMLLLLRDYSGDEASSIELVNCNPDVRKILTISNFGQLFEIR